MSLRGNGVYNKNLKCLTSSYHLRGMKSLMKYELLQLCCHGLRLVLKFEMNVSSRRCVTYNRGGLTQIRLGFLKEFFSWGVKKN